MKFSSNQYEKLCKACNDILLDSKENLIGEILPVKILASNGLSLSGECVI